MNNSKQPSSLIARSPGQQHSPNQELLLWQEYFQQLTSIAGVLSDRYWVTQGLSMLKLNDQEPLQSKTKQALRLLNGQNSKLELINKILKNLTSCSTIDNNQEKLVKQVIKLTNEWEKWKHLKVSKLHFEDGIFGNNQGGIHQNEKFPENMETFETEFEDRRFKEFEESYDREEKEIEI